MPERLPGLYAHGWPRVWLGLSWADRRNPHAANARDRERGVSALRLEPLRRVLRGVSREDRHPGGARPPSRAGAGAVSRARVDASRRVDVPGATSICTRAAARTCVAAPTRSARLDEDPR